MANDKKDELFDLSLGDGLIDIPEASAEETTVTEIKKPAGKTEVHDDGSFEINEYAEVENEAVEEENEAAAEIKTVNKTKDKKTPSDGSSSDSSPSSSPYLAFAKDRADEGVFLNFSDEDWKNLVERNEGDEAQALRELSSISMSEKIKSGINNYKESLTSDERLLYEAKEKGLPLDKYSVAKRNHTKYSKITADQVREDPKIAEDVMSKFLELKGFTPDEIAEEIEGYKALENLGTKAVKALEVIPKAFEKEVNAIEANAVAEEEEKKDKIRQRVAKMKGLVENVPEIVPGIKLTKAVKDKIMESMTVPVAQDAEGNPLNPVMATRLKNPEAFEMMIHYYHQLGLFNIDDSGNIKPDFTKIAKIENTKAVSNMRSVFESKENTSVGKAAKIKTATEELDEFDRAFGRLGK